MLEDGSEGNSKKLNNNLIMPQKSLSCFDANNFGKAHKEVEFPYRVRRRRCLDDDVFCCGKNNQIRLVDQKCEPKEDHEINSCSQEFVYSSAASMTQIN